MKSNRAPGPGGIPIELLKYATEDALEYVKELFNDCLFRDDIPEEWKLALISSLHKKGDKKDCGNYRGISVLASMGFFYSCKEVK